MCFNQCFIGGVLLAPRFDRFAISSLVYTKWNWWFSIIAAVEKPIFITEWWDTICFLSLAFYKRVETFRVLSQILIDCIPDEVIMGCAHLPLTFGFQVSITVVLLDLDFLWAQALQRLKRRVFVDNQRCEHIRPHFRKNMWLYNIEKTIPKRWPHIIQRRKIWFQERFEKIRGGLLDSFNFNIFIGSSRL